MSTHEPRCPAMHPDLPYSRCALDEQHVGTHRNFTGNEWTDAPDLADGGVTCAAIEQEAECASCAEGRANGRDARDLLGLAPMASTATLLDTIATLMTRAEKAERAAQTFGKVIEDQCRDIARITRSEHLVHEDGDADWGAIWERGHSMAERLERATDRVDELREQYGTAVREKDEWEANAEAAEENVRAREEMINRLSARAEKAELGWAEANARNARQAEMLAEAECHNCIRDAAVIEKTRTLTPEDIDEDMIERGYRAWADSSTYASFESKIRSVLTAALTPEPPRPEGAEEIAALLDHMPADLIGGPLTAHEARTLADHLAEHGVRVTTKENR